MNTTWLPKGSGLPRTFNCADLVLTIKESKKQQQKELGGFSMTLQDSCFIKRTFPLIKLS